MDQTYNQWLCEIAVKSGLHPEAVDFILRALEFVPNYRGEEPADASTPVAHSNAKDYCRAFVGLAKDTFGTEYTQVLSDWGLASSEQLGDAIYRLIECGVMDRNEEDQREDFDGVFDVSPQ
jgi:uncharacterized repeat protein (TIGR04138 family)